MIQTPTFLRGWEHVVNAFGYWPAFHDARFGDFQRSQGGVPWIEFVVHGWEMTAEVDEWGYLQSIKHHLVRFRFEDTSEEALDDFDVNGNVLDHLELSPVLELDDRFTVTLDSAMGGDCGGTFRARRGEVLDVTACDADGRPAPQRGQAVP